MEIAHVLLGLYTIMSHITAAYMLLAKETHIVQCKSREV